MNRRAVVIMACVAVTVAACVSAFPQSQITIRHQGEPRGLQRHTVNVQNSLVPGGAVAQVFVDKVLTLDFTDRMVKGAPYSAELTNETVQTLADGNRIVRKEMTRMYRDSEGRTRREMKVPGITRATVSHQEGAALATAERETITISDPVAGFRYVLDPETRTAYKMPLGRGSAVLLPHQEGSIQYAPLGGGFARTEVITGAAPGGNMIFEQRVVGPGEHQEAKTQSLGKQTIEGLEAEGTRSTFIIPAGQLGNERPIEIVSERWYSPKLQAALLTTHSDPRFGTTTSRLSNVSLADPPLSLFEVPSGYTLKDGPAKIEIRD